MMRSAIDQLDPRKWYRYYTVRCSKYIDMNIPSQIAMDNTPDVYKSD